MINRAFRFLHLIPFSVRKNLLTIQVMQRFVNVPISSKYYHQPLPESLSPSMLLASKQSKLNQKIYLLQHIAELIDRDPKYRGFKVDKFMIEQLKKWEGSRGGRFERVAAVVWIIKKMGLKQQLKELYNEITNRIQEDQWYVDFDESVKAIESFSDLQDTELRNKIFEKIERNLIISMGDVNMTYYQRICQSLYEAQRFRTPLWDKLELHVTRNLPMQYSAKTFFDIFKYFAITKNGSTDFYQICQQIMHKGRLYKDFHMIKGNNLGQYDSHGDYFALMVQTYAIVNQHTPFPLSSDFLNYIYKGIITSKIQYKNITALTKLLKHMPSLNFQQTQIQKAITDIIQNKQFTIYNSLTDIQQLYFEVQNKYGTIPNKLKQNIQSIIQRDIKRSLLPLSSAIQLVDFVLMYRGDGEIGGLRVVGTLNDQIRSRYKYLESSQKKMVDRMLMLQGVLKGKGSQIKGLLDYKNIQKNQKSKDEDLE